MDEIIIFKEGENFKEKFSDLRFSYQRKYKLYFAQNYNQVGFILNKGADLLIFYFKDELGKQDRIRIKHIVSNYPSAKVCLCSNKQFALDAWKIGVFYFTEYPVVSDGLLAAYKRYVTRNGVEGKELILKEDGEIIKISFDKITYLQAAGNYTLINQKGDRKNVQTKQLGNFEEITEKDLNLVRIHRSLIVNTKNIKSVGNKQVFFYQCKKPLNISASLQSKLKKLLLGS